MLVAVSTDDEKNLTKNHFGDGRVFLIYELSPEGYKLVKRIENKSPEEEFHGDPNKARSIGQLLGGEGVHVLVGFAMGPNIVRMRKAFVPVISRCESIEDALNALVKEYERLSSLVSAEGDKEIVYICQ